MSTYAIVIAGAVGLAALVAPIAMPAAPRLIWNATASVPVGLYRLHPRPRLQRGMIVAVRLPAGTARLAASREYLPIGVPLLKPVAGLEGDLVCRAGARVFVDGRAIGRARARDRNGRPLPRWSGCAWLGPGDVFVMNPAVADSFDGRYFGVLSASSIIGSATPVWLASVRAIPRSRTAEERNDGTDR
jgi:conjugative transfer signal peptidase TraF